MTGTTRDIAGHDAAKLEPKQQNTPNQIFERRPDALMKTAPRPPKKPLNFRTRRALQRGADGGKVLIALKASWPLAINYQIIAHYKAEKYYPKRVENPRHITVSSPAGVYNSNAALLRLTCLKLRRFPPGEARPVHERLCDLLPKTPTATPTPQTR